MRLDFETPQTRGLPQWLVHSRQFWRAGRHEERASARERSEKIVQSAIASRCSGVQFTLFGGDFKGPVDSCQAAVAAEDGQRVEQAEADRFAGDGDADGVDDVADLDAVAVDERVRRFFQGVGGERLDAVAARRGTRIKQFDAPAGLRSRLSSVCVVICKLLVGDEEVVVVEDVAGDFHAVAGRFEDLRDVRGRVARRRIGDKPARCRNGTTWPPAA